jgi:putative chitinase
MPEARQPVGVELVHDPDLALQPGIAAAILFNGMEGGLLTGASLGRYFNGTTDDPVNARRVIK